jgi:hypothetical protein
MFAEQSFVTDVVKMNLPDFLPTMLSVAFLYLNFIRYNREPKLGPQKAQFPFNSTSVFHRTV